MLSKSIAIPTLSRRSRRRGLVLAAGVGVVTLLIGFAKQPRVVLHPVWVATTSLPAGTIVQANDLTERQWATAVPGAVTNVSTIIGHPLDHTVVAQQPVMTTDLQFIKQVDGLNPDEVGMMLPVSLASSDNVQPGDRVAVIWLGASTPGNSKNTGPRPGTVLASGLRVLSVLNQNGGPVKAYSSGGINASTPSVVELAVPVSSEGTLAVAAESNRVWLALDPWVKTAIAGSALATSQPSRLTPTPTSPPNTHRAASSIKTPTHKPSTKTSIAAKG